LAHGGMKVKATFLWHYLISGYTGFAATIPRTVIQLFTVDST